MNDVREFNAELLNVLANHRKRTAIKKLFAIHGLGDANAISMSLYEGPRGESHRKVHHCAHSNGHPGWLLTGDAKLGNKYRREAWLRTYTDFSLKDHVGTLMLPHHGAYSNFHADILSVAPASAI